MFFLYPILIYFFIYLMLVAYTIYKLNYKINKIYHLILKRVSSLKNHFEELEMKIKEKDVSSLAKENKKGKKGGKKVSYVTNEQEQE